MSPREDLERIDQLLSKLSALIDRTDRYIEEDEAFSRDGKVVIRSFKRRYRQLIAERRAIVREMMGSGMFPKEQA